MGIAEKRRYFCQVSLVSIADFRFNSDCHGLTADLRLSASTAYIICVEQLLRKKKAMARVTFKDESGIAGMSGRVGNLVFRRAADGKTYAQQAPIPTKRKFSAAQLAHQLKLKDAAAYGQAQQRDAAGQAYYQRFVPPGSYRSVYSMAVADFMKSPQVLAVVVAAEAAGPELRVLARKPCGVTAVWVRLLDTAGQVLEEGAATPAANDWWTYAPAQPLGVARQVQAVARDRSGNEGTLVTDLE